MADYHVLGLSGDGDAVTVAFHVSVPAETNVAGKVLSEALIEDRSPKTSVPYLSVAAADEVSLGIVYEHVETVSMSGKSTNQERIAILDARATELQTAVLARLRKLYAFWGYERTVS
jgi:hypothetical protein